MASGYGLLYFVKILGNRRDLLRSATKDKYKMKGQTTRAQLTEFLSCIYFIIYIPLYTRLTPDVSGDNIWSSRQSFKQLVSHYNVMVVK